MYYVVIPKQHHDLIEGCVGPIMLSVVKSVSSDKITILLGQEELICQVVKFAGPETPFEFPAPNIRGIVLTQSDTFDEMFEVRSIIHLDTDRQESTECGEPSQSEEKSQDSGVNSVSSGSNFRQSNIAL